MCAPLCCKNLCCASRFRTGGRGAGGSRSKNLLEGAMKRMLVQGHTLRLLDEARELGAIPDSTNQLAECSTNRGFVNQISALLRGPLNWIGAIARELHLGPSKSDDNTQLAG